MKDVEFQNVTNVEENHFWFRHKRFLISKLMKEYRLDSDKIMILDSGCGTGRDIKDKKNGIGFDYNFFGLMLAKSNNDKMVNGDIHNLPFKDNSFDLILSMDLLQHENIDLKHALIEYRRVLKAGGYIFINLPAYDFLFSKHDIAVGNGRRFNRIQIKRYIRGSYKLKKMFYWNTFLLPVVLLQRKFMALFESYANKSDVRLMNKKVNRLFEIILKFESVFSLTELLPFGVSVFAIAQKRIK